MRTWSGGEQIALMKPDAILINTSRGEVLDAAALADAIREKRLAGAAIDVYWPEPPQADFPLLGLDNVLLTPHMAARTEHGDGEYELGGARRGRRAERPETAIPSPRRAVAMGGWPHAWAGFRAVTQRS